MVKRLLAAALALTLALTLALSMAAGASADDDDVNRTIRNARNGVVRVVAIKYYSDGSVIFGSGTAFGVGRAGEDTDTFITNWHVVTNSGEGADEIYLLLDDDAIVFTVQYDDYGNGTSYVEFGENFATQAIPVEVLYTTDGYPDVAVLRAMDQVSGIIALPVASSETLNVLDTVYALGYPALVDYDNVTVSGNVIEQRYLSGVEDVTVTTGNVTRLSTLGWAEDTRGIIHEAHINSGNSGGPLLNSDGAAVGINTYTYTEDNSYSVSIYVDYAMEALDDLGISYDVYGDTASGGGSGTAPDTGTDAADDASPDADAEPEDNSDGGNSLIYILVAVGAVAVIAAVIVALVMRSKKKKSAAPLPRQQYAPEQRYQPERAYDDYNNMNNSVNNMSAASPMPETWAEPLREPEARVPRATVTLIATDGILKGQSWPLRETPVTIGRETDCEIRFPPNTAGVSRRHCSVRVRDGVAVLTDLGSSNGTFIGGTRLTPNMARPLRPGESFCLANGKNTFTVR